MDVALGLPVLVGLIAVALLFDFLNGLHDAANSIATIVSTRVLRPQFAVFWAAFFNFVAFMVFGLHVAQTIGTGIIDPAIVDAQVIFAALVGAIVWNLVTWALGIPSSSSHALIGGLFGAGVAKAGLSAAVWSGLSKTVIAIVLSPLVGFLLAMVLVAIVSWASVRSTPFAVDRAFRILQFASASLYSLGHGGNDAQKTMGIIAVLLYSQGQLGGEFFVPFWVVLSCQAAMAMGTLMGGWRIVRTMGLRITKLTPMQGFCAETGGAATLFMATFLGVPVSTTHTITGAIVGVGRRPPPLGGALECRQLDRLCLGHHDAGLRHRRRADLVGSTDLHQVTSFSPTIPATISPMLARRNAVAGSPNRMMPSVAVPTAPMPVQTA
ncbi:PiT family inorganic phosphate transporter [Bradyrhizobium sp. LM3.4]